MNGITIGTVFVMGIAFVCIILVINSLIKEEIERKANCTLKTKNDESEEKINA